MITANIIGPGAPGGMHNFGLCNQMFIIATTLSLAFDNNVEATFPDLKNTNKFGNYKNNIFKNLNLGTDKSWVKYRYFEKSHEYSKIPFINDLEINGYFQSEKYFLHNKEKILKIFSLPKINFEYGNNVLGIHIRRGDYLNLKNIHPVLSETNYYKNALSKFNIENYKSILIFSDDINWCKNNFKINNKNLIYMEGNSDIVDLSYMSKCDDMIIANSTFSWWGAWLNENVKKVVAPKLWFANNQYGDTKDIIPEKWVLV